MKKITLYTYIGLMSISVILILIFANENLVYEWGDIVNSLLSGNGYTYLNRPTAYMPPLYPLCIALFKYLFGDFGIKLLHAFFFAFTYVIFLKLLTIVLKINSIKTNINSSPKIIHLLLPFLFFLYPPVTFGYLNVSIFPLSTLLFISYIYLLAQLYIEFKISFLIKIGIISALLTLSRSEFIYIGPLTLIIYVFLLKLKLTKKVIGGLVTYLIILFLTVSPWIIRNKLILGEPALSTAKYYNLWRGNNLIQSTIPINPEEYYTQINFYTEFTEIQQEKFLKFDFEKYVKENKIHFITGVIKKMRNFYFSYYPNAEYHGKLSKYLFIPWGLIIIILLFILIQNRKIKQNPLNIILIFMFVIYGLIHGLTQVLPRYNLQFLIPFIVIIYSQYLAIQNAKK